MTARTPSHHGPRPPARWRGLVSALLACGTSIALAGGGSVQFPHPDGYKEGAVHGADALSYGIDACYACHRDPGQGAPACTSCHADFPHPEGWLDGQVHGAGLGGDDGATHRAACLKCHDQPGLDATEKAPCTGCHGSYPHPDGWKDAGHHGAWVIARGSAYASCGSCHGADLHGQDAAPSCDECHTGYPHPDGWEDGDAHGAAAADDFSSCGKCHGDDGSGGTAGVACTRCHAAYPHPSDWSSTHIATANSVGEAICLDCHQQGDGPSPMPASCGATCHGGGR